MNLNRHLILLSCSLLIVSCSLSNDTDTFDIGEAKSAFQTQRENLKKKWAFVGETNLNNDEIPELYCYNNQDTIKEVVTESGVRHWIRPDYSEGCTIYQVISKDSLKRLALIFQRDELAGVTDGFKNITTKIQIQDPQVRNEVVGKLNIADTLFLETKYQFDKEAWCYKKSSTRFLLMSSHTSGKYVD